MCHAAAENAATIFDNLLMSKKEAKLKMTLSWQHESIASLSHATNELDEACRLCDVK